METKKTTPSEENYLEWIYRFSQQGAVRLSELADKLGVKRPSVTKAMYALKKKGLLHYHQHGKVELTEAGTALARGVVRRDECLTRLLVQVLDMTPDEADAEVHRLEHVLGDEVLYRLEALVEFTLLSPAWLKRLHLRIQQLPTTEAGKGNAYRVGHASIHSGFACEKSSHKPQKHDD